MVIKENGLNNTLLETILFNKVCYLQILNKSLNDGALIHVIY